MIRFIRVVITSLFVSLNVGALLYVTSTFLGRFFTPSAVSLLFILGALGNTILFLLAPRLLNLFGKRLVLLYSLLLTALGTFGLALAHDAWSAGLAFIIYGSFLFMNYYCLDIFLEELSSDGNTGEVRGIYLTFINAGIAAGPLLLALLVPGNSLEPIYWAALYLLIPPILFSLFSLGSKREIHPRHAPHSLPFKQWWKNNDVRSVTLAKFILETFYGFMVIYTPFYLYHNLGFTWSELGLVFTVALLPFVLFEWPVGEIADRYLGEKEIMSLGFFITGTALLFMPFIGKNISLWMTLLFLSRVGASFIEITTESYFFKKIDASDTGLLSLFRLTRPIGYIFSAVFGIVFLSFFSLDKIFFLVAIIIFFGLRESLSIKDTL